MNINKIGPFLLAGFLLLQIDFSSARASNEWEDEYTRAETLMRELEDKLKYLPKKQSYSIVKVDNLNINESDASQSGGDDVKMEGYIFSPVPDSDLPKNVTSHPGFIPSHALLKANAKDFFSVQMSRGVIKRAPLFEKEIVIKVYKHTLAERDERVKNSRERGTDDGTTETNATFDQRATNDSIEALIKKIELYTAWKAKK